MTVELAAVLTLGVILAAVAAILARRVARAERALAAATGEGRLSRTIEATIAERLPQALRDALEETGRRTREEVRRATRRDMRETIDSEQLHEKIEQTLDKKLANGAFALQLKQAVAAEVRALAREIEQDVVPRALEGSVLPRLRKLERDLFSRAAEAEASPVAAAPTSPSRRRRAATGPHSLDL